MDTTGAAYNNGDPAVCAAAPVNGVDQRGFLRGGSCTIGAYEPSATLSVPPPGPAATPEAPSSVLFGGGIALVLLSLGYRARRRASCLGLFQPGLLGAATDRDWMADGGPAAGTAQYAAWACTRR